MSWVILEELPTDDDEVKVSGMRMVREIPRSHFASPGLYRPLPQPREAHAFFEECSCRSRDGKRASRPRPSRGTSSPGIVRRTAGGGAAGVKQKRQQRAKSGYFSWRLLLRCGDYVCPLICAETRQRGPLSVAPRRSVGLWVFGSRASRYVLSFITRFHAHFSPCPQNDPPAVFSCLSTEEQSLS
ncbi:hypothetical protein KM043_009906 [Ampulex compressa]|nr:hypothetical protein KM043_009906 [Ampulex compressa]